METNRTTLKNALDRYSSMNLGKGKCLCNRIVVPPMASQTATTEGLVTEKTVVHYERLAESKPGLLMVEYTYVDISGRSEDFQLGLQDDRHIEGLSRIAKVIQCSGAIAGIQITHGGGKTERSLTGGALMGPSAVSVPVKDRLMQTPDAMKAPDMELWKSTFLAASDRAVKAGFDLVEFHAAHGYGLNQWLSPITNQRNDEYGGKLTHRMRLLLDIVGATRLKYPELLISVRMPGQDFLEGGLQLSQTVVIAQALAAIGVDLIHVSSGIGGWRRPQPRNGEGYLVDEAAKIQAAVKVPVIGVGGIETGEYIDESLSLGRFSLAAVGRAILSDPKGWRERQMSGR